MTYWAGYRQEPLPATTAAGKQEFYQALTDFQTANGLSDKEMYGDSAAAAAAAAQVGYTPMSAAAAAPTAGYRALAVGAQLQQQQAGFVPGAFLSASLAPGAPPAYTAGAVVMAAPSGAAAPAAVAAPAVDEGQLPVDLAYLRTQPWWKPDLEASGAPRHVNTSDASNSVSGSYTFSAMVPLSALQEDNGVIRIDSANMTGAFEPTGYTPANKSHAAVLRASLSGVRAQVVTASGAPIAGYPDLALHVSTLPQSAARVRVTGHDSSHKMAFAHVVVVPSDAPQTFDLGDVSNGVEHDGGVQLYGIVTPSGLKDDLGDRLTPRVGPELVAVRLPSITASAVLASQTKYNIKLVRDDLVGAPDVDSPPTQIIVPYEAVTRVHESLLNPEFSRMLVDPTQCTLMLARTDGKPFTDSSAFSAHRLKAPAAAATVGTSGAPAEAGAAAVAAAVATPAAPARGGFKPEFVGRVAEAYESAVLRISGVVTQTVVFPGIAH